MCSLSPYSFSLITFPPKIFTHSDKMKQGELKNPKKQRKKKRRVVHMSKSIKHDADIMLLISQHLNIMSL